MGIQNIQILIEPEMSPVARQARVMLEEKRIAEHRRGEHSDGFKRRDCPLCRAGK